MQNNSKVMLLWTFLAVVLLTLVLVLSITGQQRNDLEKGLDERKETIQELEQDKNNLKEELKAKRLLEKTKLASKPVPKPALAGNSVILEAVYTEFWRDSRFATLIACESDFIANSVGYDGHPYYQYNYGLFQISDGHGYSAEYLFNPTNNIKVAKQIYLAQGFAAWPQCSRVAGFI